MKSWTRHITWFVGALAAAAIVVPTAQASSTSAAVARRACADFGLTWDYNRGCVQSSTAAQLIHGRASKLLPSNLAAVARRACADFGLRWDYARGCMKSSTESQLIQERSSKLLPSDGPSASGFHWNDAGIGAAAMLGVVLLVSGVGASVALAHSHRRKLRSA